MENFIVSARKYRPATFDTVVGQSAITTTLKNAIKNNILAQAFLFCGPRGVGKTTCARIMAKSINCMNPRPDAEACDQCESCTSFNRSSSFNIHELDAASNNSVDDIRTLVEQVRIPPQVGKYKIYIIDEVHMLSAAAFNAFLKTLEEPPAYAKFILATTEKHKILPTILSRCQIFDFKRITIEDITKHLQFVATKENVTADEEALNILAQKSDGALRDALSLFDQMVSFSGNTITYKNVIENLNVLDYDYFFKITEQLLQGDSSAVLLTLNEIIDNGFDGQHLITGFGNHLRSLLVSKDASTLKLMETGENLRNRYSVQAQQWSAQMLLKALDINNQCDLSYRTSNNKRLHLEISLLQISALNSEQSSGLPEAPKVQFQQTTSQAQAAKPQNPVQTASSQQNTYTVPQAQPLVSEPRPISAEEPSKLRPSRTISIGDAGKVPSPITPQTEIDLSTTFDEEGLKKKWIEFIELNKTELPSFTNAISRYDPLLSPDFEISFKTDNALVVSDKQNINLLLDFLKTGLQNTHIRLNPILEEKPKELDAYTDKEKFEKIATVRPYIRSFKEQLGLETEF